MTGTNDLIVTIDDAIRVRPDLLAQVEEASRFFEQEYQRRIPLDDRMEPTRLRWTLTRGRGQREFVQIEFAEHDGYGEREFSEEPFPISYLFDDVNRESMMYRTLGTVTHLRGRDVHKRAEALLRELEREEGDGDSD